MVQSNSLPVVEHVVWLDSAVLMAPPEVEARVCSTYLVGTYFMASPCRRLLIGRVLFLGRLGHIFLRPFGPRTGLKHYGMVLACFGPIFRPNRRFQTHFPAAAPTKPERTNLRAPAGRPPAAGRRPPAAVRPSVRPAAVRRPPAVGRPSVRPPVASQVLISSHQRLRSLSGSYG